ncbi:MAG: hypothetical protein AUK48_13790 [Oscillatoriales cyanobacterium CG2_30_44_21]|nr:MAG: hypothetical protein AUK48_13790 [Oscillatoriales cyanobacterium CG2_30_44_21]
MKTISLDADSSQFAPPASPDLEALVTTTSILAVEPEKLLGGLKISRTKQKGDCLYLYSQEQQADCAAKILEEIALSTQDLAGSVLFAEGIRKLKLHGKAWALGIDLPISQSAIVAAEIITALLKKFQENPLLDNKLAQAKLKLLLQNSCLNLLCETRQAILQAEIALPILDTLRTLKSSEYFQTITVSNRVIGDKNANWSFEIDLLAIGTQQASDQPEPIAPPQKLASEFANSDDIDNEFGADHGFLAGLGDRLTTLGNIFTNITKQVLQLKWLGQPSQDNAPNFRNLSLKSCAVSLAIGISGAIAIDRTLSHYASQSEPVPTIATVSTTNLDLSPNSSVSEASPEKLKPNFNIATFNDKLTLLDWYVTKQGRSPDVIIVGSSRALRGIEPSALEKALAAQGYKDINVFNLGIDGATAKVVNLQITQILSRPQLPRMIIWADGLRAFNSRRSDITYEEITASVGYKQLEKRLKNSSDDLAIVSASEPTLKITTPIASVISNIFATNAKRQEIRTSVVKSFDRNTNLLSNSDNLVAVTRPTAVTAIDPKGFVAFDLVFDPDTYFQKYPQVPGDYDLDYRDFETSGAQFDAFANVVDFCRRNNIELLLVNMPLHSTYLDFIRTNFESIFNQRMQELARREGFTYIDLSQSIPNQSDLFSDPSHLNKQGAIAIAQMLGQNTKIPWQSLKRN